jgi:hypothetical protein
MANELKLYLILFINNSFIQIKYQIFKSKILIFLKKGKPFSINKYKKLFDSVLVL